MDQTDQSAPAHQEHEGTHWGNVPRVNANTMMNVEVKEPVTILDAQIPVPMHVAKVPNVELVIMALFARVQGYVIWEGLVFYSEICPLTKLHLITSQS